MIPHELTIALTIFVPVATIAVWIYALGRVVERVSRLESRMGTLEEAARLDTDELKRLIEAKHERIRHDLNDQNQIMIGLIEEKGRNTARHEENRRVLNLIESQLERLNRRLDEREP